MTDIHENDTAQRAPSHAVDPGDGVGRSGDETPSDARSALVQVAANTLHLLVQAPLALARFVVLLPLTVLGVGLSPLGIGIPILLVVLMLVGWFARLERARLDTRHGEPVPRPTYRVDLRNARASLTDLRTMLTALRDPMRVREWLHGVLSLPVALVTFMATVGWWSLVLGGLSSPLFLWSLPESEGIGRLIGFDSAVADAVFNLAVGVVLLLRTPWMMRGLAAVHDRFGYALLTPRRVEVLESRVTQLAESRDAAVWAESDSLRRLERDLHDGPQQRLVRLAMDLSSVQRRLDHDPDSARPLVDEAVQQTRETLEELRALSRGIAPPILSDRGLSAALAAVAGRSSVRTEVEVDLPDGVRLDQAMENAVYFVCAEALTNVNKHSQASRCTMAVSRDSGPSGTVVHVIVTDDGIGGAQQSKGHGITGLGDRIRALGGNLQLESPAGGPTVLWAEIPCGS